MIMEDVYRYEKVRITSSGYRSSSELRGMCSVSAKVCIPFAMAVRTISSRESLACPGQNCPEWECIEKAIFITKKYEDGCR